MATNRVSFLPRVVGLAVALLSTAWTLVGSAPAAVQRSEDYAVVPLTSAFQNHFGQRLATDGNTSVVLSNEVAPSTSIFGRVYFLELKQGRWEVEYVTGDLPGGPMSVGPVLATIERDLAVVSGWASAAGGQSFHNFLYTFRRQSGQRWSFESIQRVPRVRGFAGVAQLKLRAGLLTFSDRDQIVTYERVADHWRRRPNAKVNPILSGSVEPRLPYNMTRGDRDLFAFMNSGVPFANAVASWSHFEWIDGHWRHAQIIGSPQPPHLSGDYVPNGGTDADGEWFMYGAHPTYIGVGVVMVLRKSAVTGDYEYHSTLQPANSFPGPQDVRDQFGSTLDLDSATGRLVVGAPWSGGPGGGIAGRVLMFRYDAVIDEWVESEELTYSERSQQAPNTFVDFGYRVTLWDNGALVSARIAPSASGVQAVGKVYAFEDSFGSTYCAGTVGSSGQAAQIDVAGSNVLPYAGWRVNATGLPTSSPFSVMISDSSAAVVLPGGNGEMFCVGGPRSYTGGIRVTEMDGSASVGFDLSDPSLAGVLAGAHRFVQVWFRTPVGSVQAAGLTNAVDIVFR